MSRLGYDGAGGVDLSTLPPSTAARVAELSAVATAAGMTNGGWDEEIALDATVSYLREVMLPRERVERVQGRRDAVEDAVAVAAARVRVEQGNVVG